MSKPLLPSRQLNTTRSPSPAQQAFRNNVLAKRAVTSPPTPPRAASSRSLAAKDAPTQEGLGQILGSEAPTMGAGVVLGFTNGTKLGQQVEEQIGIKASRFVGVAAGIAKFAGVDALSPTIGSGASAVIRSELNDLSRSGGEALAKKVNELLEKEPKTEAKSPTSETTESKTEQPKTEDKRIEVVEAKTPMNGARDHARADEQRRDAHPQR